MIYGFTKVLFACCFKEIVYHFRFLGRKAMELKPDLFLREQIF